MGKTINSISNDLSVLQGIGIDDALVPFNIKSVGVDLCSMQRIQKIIDSYSADVLTYLFSQYEYQQSVVSQSMLFSLTSCFATKEAVGKTLGIGMTDLLWSDIELYQENEPLMIKLSGTVQYYAEQLGFTEWRIFRSLVGSNYVFLGVVAGVK